MDFTGAAHRIVTTSGTYTGGPIDFFEQVGRNALITALQNGLLPDHNFLDFGAGSLRLGYWFVRFLEADRYHAIEPMKNMIDAGLANLFSQEILSQKRPAIHISGNCDMSYFGEKFDFVIARSILTHTAPGMLRKIFSEFATTAAPGGTMLASYWAATGPHATKLKGPTGEDLANDDFSFLPVVRFTFEYLKRVGAEHGLTITEILSGEELIGKQIWLRIKVAEG